MNYKTNTPEHYIYHLYKKYNEDLGKHYNKLVEKTKVKVGTAYGNFQISTKDIFEEQGNENLKFKRIGYGKLQLMGEAVFFENKKVTDLYYKSNELKQAIENFIKAVDILNEEKTETLSLIHKQHGRPKEQHCVIWDKVIGYLK